MKTLSLRFWDVCVHVPQAAGAYLLVDRHGRVPYTGRSDRNLRQRALDHLPGAETNALIRAAEPVAIVIEPTFTSFTAYEQELSWWKFYQPWCNKIEPAKPAAYDALVGLFNSPAFQQPTLSALLQGAARPSPAPANQQSSLVGLLQGVMGTALPPAPVYQQSSLSNLLKGVMAGAPV